jgi:hypothetical protein
VQFSSTIIDDRGPGAAESWSGADLAITATISDGEATIRKAILIQAKLGKIDDLDTEKLERLRHQIRDMKKLTRSPKVMDIPEQDGVRTPRIISGTRILHNDPFRPFSLESYVVARVLTTLDGDTRGDFVESVQESRLTRLKIRADLTQ